ncbi:MULTISPECIES: DUF6204 family protein [unclassified Streptomyces]|uniref:DUF6204 family protein n=1 Tax=unclassified Streptomyces TaxID=2593676 RepID=UPI00382359B7
MPRHCPRHVCRPRQSPSAALTGNAAEHNLLNATLTDEGTLISELPPRNSTYRCVVRQPADADDAAAVQRACDRAAADLANRGIRRSTLRGTATSLDDRKIRRPRR